MTARNGQRPVLWLLLATLVLAAGCTSLPSSGPVEVEPIREQFEGGAPVDFTPGGPEPGAAPVEVVRGFLVAMQATPVNTSVARRFLTAEGSQGWVPERGTVIYEAESRSAQDSVVRLDLEDTVTLDRRGRWLGRQGDRTYRLRMVREDGEWRIDNPPDRLIIPQTHFETRFAQYHLYFFDKAAEVLVPEPVYVPTGAQTSTSLVLGLLQGPDRELLGVERTFIPAKTTLDDISVPVSAEGVAEVPLSDEVLDADPERQNRAFAQLAWTLRQVPGIERMRVTVDGSPLDLPGAGADLDVDRWSEFDPALSWASQSLFGIRKGRVVTEPDGDELRVSGAFGSLDLGPRLIAVDLLGERIAATAADGTVLVAPRSRATGTDPRREDVATVLTGGAELLKPVWDAYGELWLLDRTAAGARVSLVSDRTTRTLDVPGVSGKDVQTMVLSRDGTRLVAEVVERDRERVVVARVQRDPDGSVRRVMRATPLRLGGLDIRRIRDVAFITPGSLALLTAPTATTSQVVVVKVDGSSTTAESTTAAEVFQGVAESLVTSPVLGSPVYLHTPDGQMFVLSASGRWTGAGIKEGLRSPTYVG